MSTTSSLPGGPTRVVKKGAPQIVGRLCDKLLDIDGPTLAPMDRSAQEAFIDRVEGMAARGLRTLFFAYRDVYRELDDEMFWKETPESELTLVGVV
jgi:magnesium-transporting ATPase (P-type)